MRRQVLLSGFMVLGLAMSAGCGDETKRKTTGGGRGGDGDVVVDKPGDDKVIKPAAAIVDCSVLPVALDIKIEERRLSVDPATIRVGDTIRWTSKDAIPHTVTEGDPDAPRHVTLFDTGEFKANQPVCIQFNKPGYFTYFCDTHKEDTKGSAILVEAE